MDTNSKCCGEEMEDLGWKSDITGNFIKTYKCKTCGAIITRAPTPEETEAFDG
jgi:hypothetical protein